MTPAAIKKKRFSINTLRAHLAIMLMAAFTLISFLAALNGYLSSMKEAEKLMDNQLHHASEVLMLNNQATSQAVIAIQYGDDFSFQMWRNNHLLLRSALAPETPINDFQDGFQYSNFSGYRWRTFTQHQGDRWAIVAERADLRHLLAEKVVLESIMPLLLWLPVSALMIWVLVGLGLKPLEKLSQQINLKRSDDLSAIEYANPPQELVQLIDSTNSLLGRLTSSFEREKNFSSHAAHELRTPLSVLKVHLHNMAKDLPIDHQGLECANEGVRRMHHLVEQILDLNRVNPEVIEANFNPLDLHKLAQRVTASCWLEFADKKQTLSLNGGSVFIDGDDGLIETLLQNLLDNARKYTPENGSIEVFTSQLGDKARLQIADTGPGIPVDQREQVFKRFYRFDSQGFNNVIGAGLGLAIVQYIVQIHHAKIMLSQHTSTGGLLVTVDFPIISGDT